MADQQDTPPLYASVAPQFTRGLRSAGLEVGYTDEGGVWQFVAPALAQRLPLRAIEWCNLMGATKRIEQLPLQFVETAADVAEPPLACVYLVKCEDLESYRSHVRTPLAAWVAAMTSAQVEWLVLYVPLGTRAKAAGNAPNAVYRKIYDKLRADFAHRKGAVGLLGAGGNGSGLPLPLQERVCKLDTLEGASVLGQQQQHESQWTELLLRLRHCVMAAFQTRCFQYEERLRALDARRSAPNWDFGAFFLAKERLALMYQQMHLQDDAIRHLDELDAIFANLKSVEKQRFRDVSKRSFASDDPIFTQSPLALDLRESQREIAANRASARSISLHCFCRQMRTLYLMGSLPQLLRRANTFVEAFLSELKALAASGDDVQPHQPYLWAVGACLELACACERSWSGCGEQQAPSSTINQAVQTISREEMSRELGNLLYLARCVLKNFAQTSSVETTGSSSVFKETIDDEMEAESSITWYERLQRVLVAAEGRGAGEYEPYERCVWEVSRLASQHFSQSGRHRFAVFLGGECARYHLGRGELESASRLLRALARRSEVDGWWAIFGDCVRRICRAEVALGRSTQAVAVCFSMLQVAQKEGQTGVGKDEVAQLMRDLVGRLEGNQVVCDAQESLKEGAEAADTAGGNMGELFQARVAVETAQTNGSALNHGEIRVTLDVSNELPADVRLEKLRVRFGRQVCSGLTTTLRDSPVRAVFQQTSPEKDVVHLDDLALDDPATARSAKALSAEDNAPEKLAANAQESSMVAEISDNATLNVSQACAELEGTAVLVFEEKNVLLDEKRGVSLVFHHTEVPVGRYACMGVECVLAGNTFQLLPLRALELASFEIIARESTVRVAILGAPLLTPGSLSRVENVEVCISTQDDTVVDGVLELSVISRSDDKHSSDHLLQMAEGTGSDEIAADGDIKVDDGHVRLLGAQERDATSSDSTKSAMSAGQDDIQTRGGMDTCCSGSSALSISLLPMAPNSSQIYIVSLAVSSPLQAVSDEKEPVTNATIRAQVRYRRDVSGSASTMERRCTEAHFCVMPPIMEQVRIKRVGTQLFVAIALTCNGHFPVELRDFRLRCLEVNDAQAKTQTLITVTQDLNARLRGTKLRPHELVHLAYTLTCSEDWRALATTSNCDCTLGLRIALVDAAMSWEKTLEIRVPLDEVLGPCYYIDVVPAGQENTVATADAFEAVGNEPVVFHVRVRQEDGEEEGSSIKTLALCLDERSERDWLLVGKQRERFELLQSRIFATQRQLLPTRTGRLRFPSFRLELDDSQRQAPIVAVAVPTARVFCQQSGRQVLVS